MTASWVRREHSSRAPASDNSTLLRRRATRASDTTCGVAEALDHHRGQILALVRDTGAGADGVAVLMRHVRRRFAGLQLALRLHHQLAEMHDAQISRPKMLAGAVDDRALAVLHGGVL